MYKLILSCLAIVLLTACNKNTELHANHGPVTLDYHADLRSEGMSLHTCSLEEGGLGHWCRPGGSNCHNIQRICYNKDKNGNPNPPRISLTDILAGSLKTSVDYQLFWSCSYGADFVREHYDMFVLLYKEFDGIHPDEQIARLEN